jgi:hypothetical protein
VGVVRTQGNITAEPEELKQGTHHLLFCETVRHSSLKERFWYKVRHLSLWSKGFIVTCEAIACQELAE